MFEPSEEIKCVVAVGLGSTLDFPSHGFVLCGCSIAIYFVRIIYIFVEMRENEILLINRRPRKL